MFTRKTSTADPIAAAERVLSALRERRASLQVQLDRADRELETAIAERRTRLIEQDGDAGGDTARSIVSELRDRRDAVLDALGDLAEKIIAKEHELVEAKDQAARASAAKALLADTDALAAARASFATAGADLLVAVNVVASRVLNAACSAESARFAVDDLGAATGRLIDEARAQAAMVSAGTSAPMQPAPTPPEAPPLPAVERSEVFTLARVSWSDRGIIKSCERYNFVDMPLATAERAIARGLADRRGTHRVQSVIAVHGSRCAPSGGSEFLFDGAVSIDELEQLAKAG